jgi:hypothetical protein
MHTCQKIVDKKLFNLCSEYFYLCVDAKEVCKEVERIVDINGFTKSEFFMLPKQFFWALVHVMDGLLNISHVFYDFIGLDLLKVVEES